MTSAKRPDYWDKLEPFLIKELGNIHLRDDAPEDVRQLFEQWQSENQNPQINPEQHNG